MAIQPPDVAAISAAVKAAAAREAAPAHERREVEAAAREAVAAHEARAAQEAIAKKEAEVRAFEEALADEKARKEAGESAHAVAAKRVAFETPRRKVAEDKAKTEAEIRALEAEKARLQREREKEAAHAQDEAERGAAEATATGMKEAERKIKRETPPGQSRVDNLRRLFEGDSASRMKFDLHAENSPSSESSSRATRHPCKGKRKTPTRAWRPAEKHPHDCNPFVSRSDGDGRQRRLRRVPTGCKVGVAGAGGGRSDNTPPGSEKEGLPPPYCSRESTPYRPPPGLGF